VFSKGVWKGVALVASAPLLLTAIKPLVFYTGAYPSLPLTDATAAPFSVTITAYFWAPMITTGLLIVSGTPFSPASALRSHSPRYSVLTRFGTPFSPASVLRSHPLPP
jgi:hypothetical protein